MKKILLVDDCGAMLGMERLVLDSSGYQLLTARDGEAGFRAAVAHRPDLILLERTAEVAVGHQLRTHEATREIPVLLVPIDRGELLSRIRSLLGE